jgi:hypothetical protein
VQSIESNNHCALLKGVQLEIALGLKCPLFDDERLVTYARAFKLLSKTGYNLIRTWAAAILKLDVA